jgi:hypothetical protein
MAQLQHNMWVTNARMATLSITTGGGAWARRSPVHGDMRCSTQRPAPPTLQASPALIGQNGSRARRELDQPCCPVPLLLHRYGELERWRWQSLIQLLLPENCGTIRGSTGRDATERAVHRCPRLQFGSPKMHEAVSLSMEPPQDCGKSPRSGRLRTTGATAFSFFVVRKDWHGAG